MTSTITLGVALGDVTGIGPEVALKAVARAVGEDPSTNYLLIGDADVVQRQAAYLGAESDLPSWTAQPREHSRIHILSPGPELDEPLSAGHPSAARAAVAWLEAGALLCLAGEIQGLVTAPVNKESILKAGHPFVGQTEFLAEISGNPPHAMMLLGHDDRGRWLRVVLATTHVPVQKISQNLTQDRLFATIGLAVESAWRLGLPRARVAVCGLNPHAGEGGTMGREEIEVIRPAIERACSAGWDVRGPFPADTLFHQVYRGDYEVVVAMYHDQGLVPLKMVAFDTGVNWTLGLPFIRTSPDHGTAYDIAGTGRADESSMLAALRLARQLASKI